MGDTLQGHGLFTASERLAALAGDSARLARARNRFSESPPSYRSQLSGTTTRSQSSDPPTEEQQRYDERVAQLMIEHRASWPRTQWRDEALEEGHRILQARVEEGTFVHVPDSTNLPPSEFLKSARAVVKERWIEQGIWNDEWGPGMPTGLWKHEEPLDTKSESDSENDPETQARPLFSAAATSETPKSEAKLHRLAERQLVREREREASRPFHQFVYQVSAERERIRSKRKPSEPNSLDQADINTKAYDNVKSIWVKRGIWYHRWGILPGMSWKHEQNLDAMLLEELGPRPETGAERDGSEAREENMTPRPIFGPADSAAPDIPDDPPRLLADADELGLQSSNRDHQIPSPTHQTRSGESRGDEGPSATAESLWRSNEAQPPRRGRARRTTGMARGRTNAPAKVSKPQPKKTKLKPRRGKKASVEVPPEPEPEQPQATLDRPEPPAAYTPETPRRSRRLQTRSTTKKT
ncbi:hypothetical protein PG997_009214 [Apiospora hydei]|uniref:Uncharacterized protein n=1 Tax=Apiospora hydei TaxID=1337664 RepID=A0ABR1VTF2_9PEZI